MRHDWFSLGILIGILCPKLVFSEAKVCHMNICWNYEIEYINCLSRRYDFLYIINMSRIFWGIMWKCIIHRTVFSCWFWCSFACDSFELLYCIDENVGFFHLLTWVFIFLTRNLNGISCRFVLVWDKAWWAALLCDKGTKWNW